MEAPGTQFTRFTGTKAQILTRGGAGWFDGDLPITLQFGYIELYLLYWYKSTNTDEGRGRVVRRGSADNTSVRLHRPLAGELNLCSLDYC
jgi:hypothetical protein